VAKPLLITGGIIAILAGAISQLPLSWVAPKVDIAGQVPEYGGTVWNGFISGTDAGVLKLDVSPLRLLSGKNPAHVSGGPAGIDMNAEAGLSGLRALKLSGSIKALALTDARLALVNGNFNLDIPNMKMKESCEYAEGTASTDFLARNSVRLRWKGPVLEGPVSCEDGSVILDLTGKDRAADIVARLSLSPDGQYRTVITAKVNDPNAGLALQYFGFSPSGGAYKLSEQGKWR